jgi:putrescine importer
MVTPSNQKRKLSLWDLIVYGIVLIQPIAPVPPYGFAQQLSNGHFATTIIIAMLAMMITAISYGRMANVFPQAGSAYTYVGRGFNLHAGFLIGWAMFIDYLLQPLINTVLVAQVMIAQYVPQIPYIVWALILSALFTLLNLFGIRSSARSSNVLLIAMFVVVFAFIVLALRYIFNAGGVAGAFSLEPFYDPKTFDLRSIWGATSFAALTYVGFDGITTLAEDAADPKRTIMLATVLTCAFTGVFGGLQVYLASLVWPNWYGFSDLTTAFMQVSNRVGGPLLFNAMSIVVLIAAFGSALTGGLGAAKLLFGMGRDGVLPRRTFGYLKPGTTTPTFNLLLIGALTFVGAILLNIYGNAYENAAFILNFGALLAFMGVNFATFWHFTFRKPAGARPHLLLDVVVPLTGFAFCSAIWLGLNPLAKIVGGVWLGVGVVYLFVATRGFRRPPPTVMVNPSN